MEQARICQLTALYRRRLIERAFKLSQQHGYSMPRASRLSSEGGSEEIPLVYNLYAQNNLKQHTKIIPVQQLAKLHLQQSMSSLNSKGQQKGQSSHEGLNSAKEGFNSAKEGLNTAKEGLNSAKITRTLSKHYPKMERQRSLLTMCCEEQQRLDQYETREISLESQLERVKMSKTSV